jgi:hypothetical protein
MPVATAICEEGQGHGEAHGAGGGAELEETERVTQVWVGVGMRGNGASVRHGNPCHWMSTFFTVCDPKSEIGLKMILSLESAKD